MARRAMSLVGVEDSPKDLAAELFQEDSKYRWNWKTRELYQIVDEAAYSKRLEAFWTFFERFYAGVSGLWRVRKDADANLFSLCGGRIGVAAFNSCHGNDCFAIHGMIRPEAISRSYLDLTEEGRAFDLHIAVWHHSVEGPPYRTDYMDLEQVRAMAGRGFRLGLHGHQHRAQANPQNEFLPTRNNCCFSACLCSASVTFRQVLTGSITSSKSLKIFGRPEFT